MGGGSRTTRKGRERRWLIWIGISEFTRGRLRQRNEAHTAVGMWTNRYVFRTLIAVSIWLQVSRLTLLSGLASISRGSGLRSRSHARGWHQAGFRGRSWTQIYSSSRPGERRQQRMSDLPREVREQVARHGPRMGLA